MKNIANKTSYMRVSGRRGVSATHTIKDDLSSSMVTTKNRKKRKLCLCYI